MNKDVGMRIRVERGLRDEFVLACRLRGDRASEVLRDRMQEYLRENPIQPDLFTDSGSTPDGASAPTGLEGSDQDQ